MRIWDIYKLVLNDPNNWNPNPHIKIECDVENLFNYPNSYNFICELFFGDCNFRSLAFDLNLFYDNDSKDRLKHTISLYLLGIYVASEIGFEKFSISFWDTDSKRNFLHYWLAICLFHDIGYSIESDKKKYSVSKLKKLDDFFVAMNLRYDLRAACEDKILDFYYFYRTKKMQSIDHGISGAMLMYDSLMKRESKNADIAKTAMIVSEKSIFGSSLKEDFITCSLIIANHNMWFADTLCKKITYRKFGLRKLIGKKNIIMFYDSPMKFLLCLLDTIEPIKSTKGVLKEFLSEIDLSCEMASLTIIDNDVKHIIGRALSLQSWLGVKVYTVEKNKIKIDFECKKEVRKCKSRS